MIRHIVMWKFREGEEENVQRFLDGLQSLYGVIPELKQCEVIRNVKEGNYDAALISTFDSMEDLEAYKKDPRHVEVSNLCKSIRIDRVAVDAIV
ncbi:MAG: Dabb family protein [Oscillospiraceae bacterium]|nr:Dabb family protein [Oscillospiraceae bacterium]